MRPQILHLLIDIYESNAFANILLHFNEEVPIYLHELLHVLRVLAHALGAVLLVLYLPLHGFLVLGEFFLNMKEEVLKQFLIIHDELIDNGTVHVYAGELVRVAVDHAGHSREVIGYLLCVRVDDQIVIACDILQEVAVVRVVARQRCEFDEVLPVVRLFFPKFEIVMCQNSQLLPKALNGVDYFLDEDLEH